MPAPIKHPDLRTGHPTSSLKNLEPTGITYEIPSTPDTLAEDGKEAWQALWIFGQGAYHPTGDYLVLKRYCELLDRRKEILDKIEESGWVGIGHKGQEVVSPLAKVLQDTEDRLDKLERLLGLTPEARLRLMIGGVRAKSELDEFRDSLIDEDE